MPEILWVFLQNSLTSFLYFLIPASATISEKALFHCNKVCGVSYSRILHASRTSTLQYKSRKITEEKSALQPHFPVQLFRHIFYFPDVLYLLVQISLDCGNVFQWSNLFFKWLIKTYLSECMTVCNLWAVVNTVQLWNSLLMVDCTKLSLFPCQQKLSPQLEPDFCLL